MQGYKRPLQLEDVFDLAPPDRAEEVAKEFDRIWDKELQKKATAGKPSLVRNLCAATLSAHSIGHAHLQSLMTAASKHDNQNPSCKRGMHGMPLQCFAEALTGVLLSAQQWAAFKTVAHLFVAAVPFKLCNDAAQFVGAHRSAKLQQLLSPDRSGSNFAHQILIVCSAVLLAGLRLGWQRPCPDSFLPSTGPFFLNLLLDVIAGGGDQSIGYLYAMAMAVGLIFGAICDNQHFQRVVRAGSHIVPSSHYFALAAATLEPV